MRVFMLADTHLGMRSGSVEWLDMAAGWLEGEFLRRAESMVQPGDVLLHLGDVFDNRQQLNLLAQHRAIGMFERFGELFTGGVIAIAGNHDVMRKNSNDVCSLDCLKWVPGVRVVKEPEVVDLGGVPSLLMPWRPGPDEEKACIDAHALHDPRYLFCHTEVRGLRMGGAQVSTHGIEGSALTAFKGVYAGHIHLRQTLSNVVMCGNPYQMTRGDLGNQKGFHVLDPITGNLDFHGVSKSISFPAKVKVSAAEGPLRRTDRVP